MSVSMSKPDKAVERLKSGGRVLVRELDENGQILQEYTAPNTLTPAFRDYVVRLIADDSPLHPTKIAVGTASIRQYNKNQVDTNIAVQGGASTTNRELAQEFTVPSTCVVSRILLGMQRVGSGVGSCWVEIQTDLDGLPSGVTVAVSDTVQLNSLDVSDISWAAFAISARPTLTASTVYHLVLRSSEDYVYSVGVLEIQWGADQSSPSQANGEGETYDGTVWAAIGTNTDFSYRVIVEKDITRTTLVNEVDEAALTSKVRSSNSRARLLSLFTPSQALDTLYEAALMTAADVIYAVAELDIQRTTARSLQVYWLIDVLTTEEE